MEAFEKVAPYLTDPLVLSGFALFLMAVLFRAFLNSPILAPTQSKHTFRILQRIVTGAIVLALVTILLGFGLAFYRSYVSAQTALDATAIVASIKEHGRKEVQWEQERGELARRNAELEATVRKLVEQAGTRESPPGLADALAQAQTTGDPSGVVTLLTRHAETLASDARQSNRAAAANFRQAANLAQWTDTRAALAAIRRATELEPTHFWSWIERGRLEMQSGDRTAAHRSFAIALEGATAVGDERMESVVLNDIGNVLVTQGDLERGQRSHEASLVIAERLAAYDPANADGQRDLAASHDRIGDVRVTSGDLAGALLSYNAGLAIRHRLAAPDPANSDWQRDLTASHDRIGDVLVTSGDFTGAMQSYEIALAIRERLVARNPDNVQLLRDLTASHDRIGDVRVTSGDLAGAKWSYEAGLAIRERLAARDPENADWQRDLTASQDRIGDVRAALSDLAGAHWSYEVSRVIRERLLARDPENADWQRDVSVSHEKIGDVLLASGDFAGARRSYEAGLVIRERLAALDPANAEWQRDLTASHDRIGDVRVTSGDLAGAKWSYEVGLAIRERLAARDPANAEWQRDLTASHDRIGDVLVASGDLADAQRIYEAALAIRERLAARDPANAEWQRDRFVSYWKIAVVHARRSGGRGEALGWYRQALGVVEAMKAAGTWAPRDEAFVGILRERIAALGTEDTAAAP